MNLEIPVLGVYPKEEKSVYQRDICVQKFIATLMTVENILIQPVSSMDEWIKKYIFHCEIIYIYDFYIMKYIFMYKCIYKYISM